MRPGAMPIDRMLCAPNSSRAHNLAMFLPSDGALLFETHDRPLSFGEDGPRQPVHIDTEVMQFAQMDVGAYGASLESLK